MAEDKTPKRKTKFKSLVLISLNFKANAPRTAGVDSKKEYFAAFSRSSPIDLPAEMVMPDLETPGNKAID